MSILCYNEMKNRKQLKNKNMELKEFIENVFVNLVDGVKAAQLYAAKNNAKVAPSASSSTTEKGNKINISYHPGIKEIEFEVVLGQTKTEDSTTGIGVFLHGLGMGATDEKGIKNYENTKIRFSIPFIFPVYED
jgi:hypothetical protein